MLSSKTFQINNTDLTFSKIVWVAIDGSDDSGDGSRETPWATAKKAFDYLNANYKQTGAIVFKPGTYNVRELFKGTSYAWLAAFNQMIISCIAEIPGTVKWQEVGEMAMSENNVAYRMKISCYGLIFDTMTADGFHMSGDDWLNEFYNCVVKIPWGGWNGNCAGANARIENTIFTVAANSWYTGNPITGIAVNCASFNAQIDPINGTKTNCLLNAIFDSNYNIISSGWKGLGWGKNPDGSPANIGVYGGPFAWGDWTLKSKAKNIYFVKLNDSIYYYSDGWKKFNKKINEITISDIINYNVDSKYLLSKYLLELNKFNNNGIIEFISGTHSIDELKNLVNISHDEMIVLDRVYNFHN